MLANIWTFHYQTDDLTVTLLNFEKNHFFSMKYLNRSSLLEILATTEIISNVESRNDADLEFLLWIECDILSTKC